MLTDSTIEMIRRRWASDRPFAGHTIESLQHKLASLSLREEVRKEIQRELARRGPGEMRGRD